MTSLLPPDPPMFAWPVRIYWEDTDASGVVYNANYLKFFERARTEWLRQAAIDQAQLAQDHGVIVVLRRVELDLIRPARLDDALLASFEPVQRKGASVLAQQRLYRREGGIDQPLAVAQMRLACLDAQTLRPHPLPSVLIQVWDRK